MNILPDETMYVKVMPEDVEEILTKTIQNDEVIDRLLYVNPVDGSKSRGQLDIPFYKLQNRLVLGECGHVDPENIREYIAHGGYTAAEKAFKKMTDVEVCESVLSRACADVAVADSQQGVNGNLRVLKKVKKICHLQW